MLVIILQLLDVICKCLEDFSDRLIKLKNLIYNMNKLLLMAMVQSIKINNNLNYSLGFQTNQNPCFKLYIKNFKTPIEKKIQLKESIEHTDSIYYKMLAGINLDIVEIPVKIKNIVRKTIGIEISDFKPWISSSKCDIQKDLKYLMLNILLPISPISQFTGLDNLDETKFKLLEYLKSYVGGEMTAGLGLVRNPNMHQDVTFEKYFSDESETKPILVYGKDISQTLIVNDVICLLFGPGYMVAFSSVSDVVIVLAGSNIILVSSNGYAHSKLVFEYGVIGVNSLIKTNKLTQILNGKLVPDNTVEITYKYKDNIKTQMFMFHKKFSNGDEYEIYNKNGLIVQTKYNWAQKYSHIISQCTITDDKTGLRFRGKVEIQDKEKGSVSKKLTLNDKIQYEKSGEQVLIDKLSNIRISNEIIIGWKAVKNANGEKRILKLGIPPDARTVIPIDEEYYLNNQKERADQAIVMDIQMPDEEDEISVVPHEIVAYSYVYSNGPRFEYKIGQLVKPDGYNDNPDVGCAKGIHFFRTKANLFKSYINI